MEEDKKEKKIFTIIVKNSIFAFIKEKYTNCIVEDKDTNKNINAISLLLVKLEKYAHIPDKKSIIKSEYNSILSLMIDGCIQEDNFLKLLKSDTEDLTVDEKSYILNAVIYVINEDKKISDNEKEVILQISRFLNINDSYDKLLSDFNTS